MAGTRMGAGNTVNLTCRMDKGIYDLLVEEAENQGISLNSLMNSMVKRHSSWERYAERVGFIPLTKKAVTRIFDQLDIKTIKKIANEVGSTMPKEMLYLTSNEYDFNNITNFVVIWGSRLGLVKNSTKDSVTTLTIHHGVSQNFSEYVAELHRAMAQSLEFKLQITNIHNNFVTMTIQKLK